VKNLVLIGSALVVGASLDPLPAHRLAACRPTPGA
jgi:hypothetical protein